LIKRIGHIGIAVWDLDRALNVYQRALGLRVDRIQERADLTATIAFLPIGDSEIELVEPATSESDVAKFLEKRGEGLHHICLEVDDIEEAMADLREKGLQVIDENPRVGPEGERFVFLHPKSAHGVLVELYELPGSQSESDGGSS
jgi:methylmalonyl-CoA epimerase